MEGLDIFDRFPSPVKVVDAGAGDGRLSAVLSWFYADIHLRSYGLESNEELHSQALVNLKTLQREGLLQKGDRVVLAGGDYLDLGSFVQLGLEVKDVHIFFNYPDGNERRLERMLKQNSSPGSLLCLLTSDSSTELKELTLEQKEKVIQATLLKQGEDAPIVPWYLSIYSL